MTTLPLPFALPAAATHSGSLRATEPQTLARCLLLALLLHVWLLVLLGNAPGGTAQPGQGVWGAINVRLQGADAPGAAAVTVPQPPVLPGGAPGAAPLPRWGGAVRSASPPAVAQPGAAQLGDRFAQPMQRSAEPAAMAPAIGPAIGPAIAPAVAPVVAPAVAPAVAPDSAAQLLSPAPVSPSPAPDQLAAPPATRTIPAPAAWPPAVQALPALPRTPAATGEPVAAVPPVPAAPLRQALPVPAAAPPVERSLPSSLAKPPAPTVDARPLESLAPLPVPPPPVAMPAPRLQELAPPPATLPAAIEPPATATPVAVPPLAEEAVPTPTNATPAPAPAPQLRRLAPPAPAAATSVAPLPRDAISPVLPLPQSPALPGIPAPGPGPAAPDAGAQLGHDVATPPGAAASVPQRLNLQLQRPRGGELSRGGASGVLPVLPRPPEVPDKLAKDIEKAGKADCRTAYSGAGILAVVPLAVDAVRKDGCKW